MKTELIGMTQQKWDSLSREEKERVRDYSGLTPQLKGLEGYRVEAITTYYQKRRFIVGRSTGWIPCHLEISRRSALGGPSAEKEYKTIKRLYNICGKN
ncbi:MAG: hypothetical protein V1913_15825 [Fibrobacterota bacterium]